MQNKTHTISNKGRTLNTLLCYFFLSLLILSCSKNNFDTKTATETSSLESLRAPQLIGFAIESPSYPSSTSIENSNFIKKKRADNTLKSNIPDPKAWVETDGPGKIDQKNAELFYRQKYKSQMFTISDQAMSKIIYPGSILDGRSVDGAFNPKLLVGISNNIRPITISTTIAASPDKIAQTSLPRAIDGIVLYRAALTDYENLYPGEIGAASLQVDRDTFRVYEELQTLYGYRKGIDAFLVNTNTTKQGENHVIKSVSAMKIKFFQHNFTIDVDDYNGYDKLFDPTGLDLNKITGGVTPVFVKSVTYGRMGIMVIESTASSEKLYKAVYKQIDILRNVIGIDRNMTDEEKKIINDASIKVKYTGIGTDNSPTEQINGLAGFIQTLVANNTYSKEKPGIPIAFQLALLEKGNKLFTAPFQINYGPFDKPYVRIEYRNIKEEVKKPGVYNGSNPANSRFSSTIKRSAEPYIACYRDPAASGKLEVPNFLDFQYETISATKAQGQNFLRIYAPESLSSRPNVMYFKNYGYEAYLEGDAHSTRHYYPDINTATGLPMGDNILIENYYPKLKTSEYYTLLPEFLNGFNAFKGFYDM